MRLASRRMNIPVFEMKRARDAYPDKYNEAVRRRKRARVEAAIKKPAPRANYTTVARTRGVYSMGEMKYYDTERSGVAIGASTNWTATEYDPDTTQEATPVANPLCLFAPVQGAAINQRIGRMVYVYGIKIRGHVYFTEQTNQSAADRMTKIRLCLVEDKESNSTQAQGEQVFTDPVTNDADVAVNTFQSLNNFGRFNVLKDKTITLGNPTMSYDGTNIEQSGILKPFKMNVKFKYPRRVRFNGTNGGTIADVIDYSWHIIANASSAQLAPTITYVCRVCYKE